MDTEPSSVPGDAGRLVIADDSDSDALERLIVRLRPTSGLAIVASVGAQPEPTVLEAHTQALRSVNQELTRLRRERDQVSRANRELENLITSTDIGVVLLDRDLHITRFTPRAQELIDLGPSDLGRPLDQLAHRLDCLVLPQLALGVLADLRTVEREVRADDGRRFLARLLPYRAVDDRVEGVVLTFVDITEIKRAEDARRGGESAVHTSEARFRLAVGAAPLIVLHQGLDLRYTWGHLLGAPIDFLGHGNPEAFPDASGDQLATSQHEVVTSGRGQRAEIELTLDGQPRVFDFHFEPIIEACGTAGVVSVGFDITDSTLAVRRLLDADRRKDEFLATLSHELRNPLTPLRSALDLQKLAGDDPERVARARAIMERQVDQLTQLVDDLLDLSRISQNKIKLARRPIALADVVEAAVEATHPLLERRRHQLTVERPDPSAVIDGDVTRLTQILVNLLNNAGKYTPPGGAITLSTSLDPARRTVAVNVRDTGVGITPDLMPHLFEIFVQRSDALGRSRDGLGIGLNLVRRLVELHGGTVRAESEGAGLGSLFVVEFPLAEGGS